ncbi:hypothetical protein ANCDUO_00308 [Ancylostoma duodenale]|uniref:Uncharacterized protein n=1 Tax=Ancylostoma duodenale TaxID=51022 RepID=A0A0C2H661_9BILA|nr:hypothetical protein ANCDUO_00308 [Ancylostoma duodenale]
MANVFNTFSFNKWADSKKEEEIDKESKRRRTEQIKRLKDRLRKERELRESGVGNGDLDLEALIEALQRGEEINAAAIEEEQPRTHHPTSYGGGFGVALHFCKTPLMQHHALSSSTHFRTENVEQFY